MAEIDWCAEIAVSWMATARQKLASKGCCGYGDMNPVMRLPGHGSTHEVRPIVRALDA